MTLLFILVAIFMLLFKEQAKQVLEALVKLIVAIADTIVSGIK